MMWFLIKQRKKFNFLFEGKNSRIPFSSEGKEENALRNIV
jgi:uncharacterized protein YegP (UPF0339 family)